MRHTLALIPGAYALAYVPFFAFGYFSLKSGKFSNRDHKSAIASPDNNQTPEGRQMATALRAHNNGLEIAPFFGLSILAAEFTKVDEKFVLKVGGIFLGSRFLYNLAYIFYNETEAKSYLRSLLWAVGVGAQQVILWKAILN